LVSDTNRYSAFVSYRHMPRDRQWAIRIMAELEAYRTPKVLQREAFPDRIGHLFRDEDEIPASTDLSDQIKDALVRSDFLIVVCSPDTPASRWVCREIELFQELGKGERIIPLLIAGEPDKSFPPELRRRSVAVPRPDGSTDFAWEEIEPVAADVRPRNDEAKSKTERRALLRLAAALLGCRFDDLARRDEERRKAKLRRQFAAAAALMSVAGIGGLWWWDANLRVKAQDCASYGERWAVPFCVGELSAAQQNVRTMSFRFHIQGGRVLDMARVNGADVSVDDEQTGRYEDEPWTAGVAEWRFAYRSDTRFLQPLPASAALYDKTGKQLRQIGYEFSEDRRQAIARFDRNFGVAERQSAEGSAIGLASPKSGEIPKHSSIGQHRLIFDAKGFLLRRAFEPVGGGASVADTLGAYGRTYEYNSVGLPMMVLNLDALGEPLVEKTGIVEKRRFYDTLGNVTSIEWLDARGKLRTNEQWFAKVTLLRDANGNIEKETYLSETGAPTIRRDLGIASVSTKYDERGNPIEWTYFGVDGKRTLYQQSYALRAAVYDRRGDQVEQAYFSANGAPTLDQNGVARVVMRYDEHGNEVDTAFFGIDGKPTLNSSSYAGWTTHYDEHGNEVEVAYFGVDGKPAPSKNGYARKTKRYDKRGNLSEIAYFGADDKPTLKDGYARVNLSYDERGNKVEVAAFGVDGKPTVDQHGVARMMDRYDERGNIIEQTYFGVDGKPTLDRESGAARVTGRYDEHGNEVEAAYFGVDGKPTLHTNGNARVTWRYDERGNQVEQAYFGVDGKPTLDTDGLARVTWRYDDRGIKIEESYFGVDGKPTLDKESGVARITWRYDERGNPVEEASFGIDGKLTPVAGGAALLVMRYDERGNIIEAAFFGADDKPTLNEDSLARMTLRYDARGNIIEQAYFGVDGRPTLLSKSDFARMTRHYDERGNVVEMAAFDAEDHPVLIDDIGAKVLYSYEDSGRRISVVYLDEHGQVVPVEVEVTGILPDSTAMRIGLKPGDRLLSYDGELIHGMDQFIAVVGEARPGLKTLIYRRGDTTASVQVPPGRLGVDIANVRAAPPPAATP
jgi:CTP:molybdopterin cytidylyltransferase MocA